MRVLQVARRVALARSALRSAARVTAAPSLARPAVASALPNAFASLPSAALQSRGFARKYVDDSDDDEFFGGEDDEESFIQYPLSSVRIGAPAPGFKAGAVYKDEITEISLDQFRGKYVVLFFYPKDFTYVCPTEIIAFNDRAAEFEALNTQLIAVSTDSPESHLAWTKLPRNKGGLGNMTIPIVADITKIISAKYGVLIEDAGVALRGLFIMDKDGVLQQMTVNNLPIGRSVDETLRLVQALQFVEEHGEVCPANWQPGEKTIIANPKEAHKYFSTVSDGDDDDAADNAGMTLIKTKADFQSLVDSGKTIVAKFEAPWCGKCSQIQPFVKELAEKHTDVTFAKLDVTLPEIETLKDAMGVEALPAFRFFKGGKEVGTPVLGYKKTPLKHAVEELAH